MNHIPQELYDKIREVLPIVCVGVVVMTLRPYSTLLLKRVNEPNKGLWGLPGGRVRKNGLLINAAKRKLEEETGIVPSPEGRFYYVGCFELFFPLVHCVCTTYAVELEREPKIMLNSEHSAFKWAELGRGSLELLYDVQEGVRRQIVRAIMKE